MTEKSVKLRLDDDKTEKAFVEVKKLKDRGFKGELHLMFDGSGKVAKIKKCEYI